MKIRTLYFKVNDMPKAVAFWKGFLGVEPHKTFDEWHEFMTDNIRFGLLSLEDERKGSNCVPVFEFADNEVMQYIERAKAAGATEVFNGLDDPDVLSMTLADPFGNEFEVSKFHD